MNAMLRFSLDKEFDPQSWIELFHASDYNLWWEQRHAQAARDHAYLVASAWDGDRMVGTVTVQSDGVNFAYIDDVVVHPAYRSRGIGSELMQHVLRQLVPLELQFVQLTPIPGRETFFARFGFVEHPAVIMELPQSEGLEVG